ncbi:hypothetical protein Pmani_018303 [Petrolisthes manimaculis]|uniref:Uncharacterized protein n=1 Tax=Petrolisthes manimaculis TaxID=1843537 RepID=A0AAE1PLR0_9EUCA|nr:hypothetical protein Pmani_018303 [Petrolisthes manimaculis]
MRMRGSVIKSTYEDQQVFVGGWVGPGSSSSTLSAIPILHHPHLSSTTHTCPPPPTPVLFHPHLSSTTLTCSPLPTPVYFHPHQFTSTHTSPLSLTPPL